MKQMKRIFMIVVIVLSIIALFIFIRGQFFSGEMTPVTEERMVITTTTGSETTTATPIETTYEQRDITVAGSMGELVGELYLPQTTQPVPIAIYAHELGMTREAGRMYAEFLASNGIATLLFDFAGGSPSSQSAGAIDEMTISSEVDDLKAVIAEVQTWSEVDATQIHVIGASQGGLVAALTAAQLPTQIRSLTLLYPAFLIPEVIRQLTQVVGGDRSLVTSLFGVYPISRAYVDDAFNLQVYETIGQYQGPVLMVHGSNDPIVDVSYSKRAVETYQQAQLMVIDGAGHSFTDEYFAQVSPQLLRFVQSVH